MCQLIEGHNRQTSRLIIVTLLAIGRVLQTHEADLLQSRCQLLERHCRQINQIYHIYCVNYLKGIGDKSNRPGIVTLLTIRMVLQTNQTDLLQSLCQLLEGNCRQIKQNYYSSCVSYYNGIVDKSNMHMIVPVLTIRTVVLTNQTDL